MCYKPCIHGIGHGSGVLWHDPRQGMTFTCLQEWQEAHECCVHGVIMVMTIVSL